MTEPRTSPIEATLTAELRRVGIAAGDVDPVTIVTVDVEHQTGDGPVDLTGLDDVSGGQ